MIADQEQAAPVRWPAAATTRHGVGAAVAIFFDPRVASPKMLKTGQNVRSTIYFHFRSGLSTYLAGLDGEVAERAAKVVFSIITNAALTKVRGQDPIMRDFAWDEVKRQYSLAAIAYLRELQSLR